MSYVRIQRMELRYRAPAARSPLDDLAVRQLPAALDDALDGLDDGRIIVLRRVEAKVRLGRIEEPGLVRQWAAQLARSVEQAIDQARDQASARARPEPDANVAVFADALDALACYVADALANRLGAWWWRSPGTLALVRRSLAAVPGPASALGPPPPPHASPGSAVEWALLLAGSAAPRLVQLLHQRAQAVDALRALSPQQAQSVLAQLAPPSAFPESQGLTPSLPSLRSVLLSVERPVPDVHASHDPRNVLLLCALLLAEQPSLYGASRLRESVEQALTQADVDLTSDAQDPSRTLDRARARQSPDPIAPDQSPDPPLRSEPGSLTEFGGLLFLLEPLRRLQLAETIQEEPLLAEQPGFASTLYLILCALQPAAFADPATLLTTGLAAPAVTEVAMDIERAQAILRADTRIREAAAALPRHLLPDDEACLRERASRLPLRVPGWLAELCLRVALHTVGHLRARLALSEDPPLSALLDRICGKAGRLLRTRTHLDLYLPLDSADADLRRAGLDLDPGWVPALGCVVSFHYE